MNLNLSFGSGYVDAMSVKKNLFLKEQDGFKIFPTRVKKKVHPLKCISVAKYILRNYLVFDDVVILNSEKKYFILI